MRLTPEDLMRTSYLSWLVLAGLTLGVQNLIYNAVFFTVQMIWGRRYVGFGTVANAVCCGFIITFFYDFLTAHFAQAATLPAQLAWVAAAVDFSRSLRRCAWISAASEKGCWHGCAPVRTTEMAGRLLWTYD